MGMIQEFKDFAMKGNVIDMAVGIIIGAAFGPIIKSLVNDVIMPPIGLAMGNVDFSNMFINLTNDESYATLQAAKDAGVTTIGYGQFINTVINFIIVAFAVFMLVKVMNSAKKKEEAKPTPPPKQEVLLGEIRDLLAK